MSEPPIEERLAGAIDRLDRAVTRAEAAAARSKAEQARLENQHRQLRAETGAAVDRLDALIASVEG